MSDFRSTIRDHLRGLVGYGEAGANLARPPGDDGLFGPGSAIWRVHGDFPTMMVGGIAALLLQMLHPAALAGVWDHSRWREDRLGRLRRTAQFLAVTTYGSTERAIAAIEHVRAIHMRVNGTLPDGTPYIASDPALLTWVHAAEAAMVLAAHRRYRAALSPQDADCYLAESATVAERLGAADVPRSEAALAAYFSQVRPSLRATHRSRASAAALIEPQASQPALIPVERLLFDAAIALLPDWAARMHELRPMLARPALSLGMAGAGGVMRWALAA